MKDTWSKPTHLQCVEADQQVQAVLERYPVLHALDAWLKARESYRGYRRDPGTTAATLQAATQHLCSMTRALGEALEQTSKKGG